MEIKLAADLLADGWSTEEVLRLSRTGALERIRPGAQDQAPAADLDVACRSMLRRSRAGVQGGRAPCSVTPPARRPPPDAVYQEKCREDALRDHGWQVVRWTWADLRDPAALRGRLERAYQRGRPS